MNLRTVWSNEASNEFDNIYNYWIKRNKSDIYSRKLWKLTSEAISIIQEKPELGISTNQLNIRMRLIAKNYYLIYKVQENHLEILKFWDVRQNPIKNKY